MVGKLAIKENVHYEQIQLKLRRKSCSIKSKLIMFRRFGHIFEIKPGRI